MDCAHTYHRWCFQEHLSSKIRAGVVTNLCCPECPRAIRRDEVCQIVDTEVLERYDHFLASQSVAADPNRRPCPTPGCEGVLYRPLAQRFCFMMMIVMLFLLAAGAGGALGMGIAWGLGKSQLVGALVCGIAAIVGIVLAGVRSKSPRRSKHTRALFQFGWPATCSHCATKTCFTCGEAWHP